MLEKGVAVREIAYQMGTTRNAVLGMKFRNLPEMHIEAPPREKAPPPPPPEDNFRYRKCLKCQKEKLLEKPMYICKECKEGDIFGSVFG
tara:strand:+ start:134 stop:400 length:267 start_codon:yes stop_codon:yes gene_type:complete